MCVLYCVADFVFMLVRFYFAGRVCIVVIAVVFAVMLCVLFCI